MNMKAFWSIVIVIIVLGVLAGAVRGIRAPIIGAPATGGSALQVCPDEMINNQMPGPGGQKASYYIVDGKRREISEFDANWVAQNCTVPAQTVY
jgi:hypothetical protein